MRRTARCAGARACRAKCWPRPRWARGWCWCAAPTAGSSRSAPTTASAAGSTSAPAASLIVRSPVGLTMQPGLGLRRLLGRQAGRDLARQRHPALGGDRRAAQGRDRARARHRHRRRPVGAGPGSLHRGLPGTRRLLRRAERQPALVARDVDADGRLLRRALCVRERRQGRGARARPQQRPQHLEAGPPRVPAALAAAAARHRGGGRRPAGLRPFRGARVGRVPRARRHRRQPGARRAASGWPRASWCRRRTAACTRCLPQ